MKQNKPQIQQTESVKYIQINEEQECVPVGCVPAAPDIQAPVSGVCLPYPGGLPRGCLPLGSVYGVSVQGNLPGGVCSGVEVCLGRVSA